MKSFREMLDQNKLLPESDLGLVSPGLETSDDKEPYNQEVIDNYDEESQVKPKVDVKESRIFNKLLSEKVAVHVVSKKHGGATNILFNTVHDAEKYINSLDLDLKKDYFDIHTGSNTSEIDGLYKWGGVKGYWYNYLNDKDTKSSEKDKIKKLQLTEAKETFILGKTSKCVVNDNGDVIYYKDNKILSKEHLKDISVEEYKERLVKKNGWKKVNENEELTEASELDYEDLVEELREKTQMVKTELDRIFNRIKYRFLLNVSYDKKEANKIQDDIWKELDKAQKMISKCYNKVG